MKKRIGDKRRSFGWYLSLKNDINIRYDKLNIVFWIILINIVMFLLEIISTLSNLRVEYTFDKLWLIILSLFKNWII